MFSSMFCRPNSYSVYSVNLKITFIQCRFRLTFIGTTKVELSIFQVFLSCVCMSMAAQTTHTWEKNSPL